jgi:molybdopterin-binding protein
MKLSARNQIAGTIHAVKPGATTTHVTIDIAGGVTITASITNEAAEELMLKPGMKAFAVIKASRDGWCLTPTALSLFGLALLTLSAMRGWRRASVTPA